MTGIPFASAKQSRLSAIFVFREESGTGGAWVPQLKIWTLKLHIHALVSKKNPISFIILISHLWCSWCVHAGRLIFISFCPCRPRFPPVCHIIITWPDALIWWIVTPRLGSVWYTSSHSALFYQLLFSGHSAAENVAGLGYFFCFLGFFSPSPLSVLAVSTPQYTQSLDAVWQA